MNIVIVDTTLTTPPTGGAQTFLTALCGSLNQQGHRTSVVTKPGPDSTIPDKLRKLGTKVLMNLWSRTHLPEERGIRLASWVNESNVDAYIISISADVGWLALPLLDPRIPTIAVVHSDGPTFYNPLRHYHPFIDCGVGVSAQAYQKIMGTCHLPVGRARHIPYGVAALSAAEVSAKIQERSEDQVLQVGYLGRLVDSQKRVMELAPLAAELKRRGISFELHLIGDGPERPALEAAFEQTGLRGSVKFWGWLDPSDVKKRLLELDVLVLLSDCEGLPLALLEGMAHGVVPVVTNLESGNAEVVKDGQNGFLLPVGDISAFADRIGTLAGDAALLADMKREAWETGRRYSVEAMVDQYLECFAELSEAERAYRRGQPDGYPLMQSCVSRFPFWLRKIKYLFAGS
ncbi:MAG TPA: glycosyltransferase family 4 protein [Pyrinomonadaceae bacterium]|nr:glycosyltransferase family 4 protein [Pyrinomonadaceae bacterium]